MSNKPKPHTIAVWDESLWKYLLSIKPTNDKLHLFLADLLRLGAEEFERRKNGTK
jgi:hypothetical protein